MGILRKITEENENLRLENEKLRREIQIEEKICSHWKQMAALFEDALKKATEKYESGEGAYRDGIDTETVRTCSGGKSAAEERT